MRSRARTRVLLLCAHFAYANMQIRACARARACCFCVRVRSTCAAGQYAAQPPAGSVARAGAEIDTDNLPVVRDGPGRAGTGRVREAGALSSLGQAGFPAITVPAGDVIGLSYYE
jgi:hypothetical protein